MCKVQLLLAEAVNTSVHGGNAKNTDTATLPTVNGTPMTEKPSQDLLTPSVTESASAGGQHRSMGTAKRKIKLHQASLPQFDGEYREWISFKLFSYSFLNS